MSLANKLFTVPSLESLKRPTDEDTLKGKMKIFFADEDTRSKIKILFNKNFNLIHRYNILRNKRPVNKQYARIRDIELCRKWNNRILRATDEKIDHSRRYRPEFLWQSWLWRAIICHSIFIPVKFYSKDNINVHPLSGEKILSENGESTIRKKRHLNHVIFKILVNSRKNKRKSYKIRVNTTIKRHK